MRFKAHQITYNAILWRITSCSKNKSQSQSLAPLLHWAWLRLALHVTFTVTPSGLPGETGASFQATSITGNSSELLHSTATGHIGQGYINYGYFLDTNNQQRLLRQRRRLWPVCPVHADRHLRFARKRPDLADLQMYADRDRDNIFVAAGTAANGVGTEASVTEVGAATTS